MDTRTKLIDTAHRLLRSQGLRETGLNEIIQESGSPRGSIYHHFPGGKEQLFIEALQDAGEKVAENIRAAMAEEKNPVAALRKFARPYVEDLVKSDYQVGCPIGNAAIDAAANSASVRLVCDQIFDSWEKLIANGLIGAGFEKKQAAGLAELMLASFEGALILCRARKTTKPLTNLSQQMEVVLSKSKKKGRG